VRVAKAKNPSISPMNQSPKNTEKKLEMPLIDFAVGGQAVIEGVMMRSPNFVTVAVRKTEGNIKVKEENFRSFCTRVKLFGIPLVRGVVNLFEMMIVGMRILNYSANEMLEDVDQNEKAEANGGTTHTKQKEATPVAEADKKPSGFEKAATAASFALSVAFALGMSLFLFKFMPLWITDYLSKQFTVINDNYLIFNLLDGVIKTIFFIVYIALIGSMPSMHRVFQYHGAEHKSIYTYESGLDLTVENAKKMTRFHPRCGTSFILVVFMISIFVYTFVPRQPDFMMNFLVRVMFLPIVAGVSYEILKWSAKQRRTFFVKMLTAPGLWFQRLTTQEPDDKQLEVALFALKKALELEEERRKNPAFQLSTAQVS
jgi:uncharacterized protein YqhQ